MLNADYADKIVEHGPFHGASAIVVFDSGQLRESAFTVNRGVKHVLVIAMVVVETSRYSAELKTRAVAEAQCVARAHPSFAATFMHGCRSFARFVQGEETQVSVLFHIPSSLPGPLIIATVEGSGCRTQAHRTFVDNCLRGRAIGASFEVALAFAIVFLWFFASAAALDREPAAGERGHVGKGFEGMAIEAQGLEIQIGARTLLNPTDFHVSKGDKIGLVGRNGAGKTTLTRVITGDMLPTSGKVRVSGKLGYLPQDTHAADPEQTALDRMMSARDIAQIISRIRKAEKEMTDPDPDVMTKAMNRYDKAMQDFEKAGGYAAQSEATAMASSLGLPQEVMEQQLGTLSGGQRRRIELARILFSDADTLILDEPTNHLDADSIEWLRGYLKKYEGGFLVISHSTELLDEVVNKVWHLDAQLGQIDMYSLGWKAYLHQRVVDEERRRREREVAEKKAERLMKQGIRLHAKATKAVAAQNMMRRAERLLSETSEAQKAEKVADIRFPEPAPCGRTPIMAKDISKAYGSNIVFAGVNLAIDKGSRVVILGYNGAGKTTTLRLLAHLEDPDTGSVDYGHGCKIGYFAQEHDTLDLDATVLENLTHVAPELNDTQARSILGSFLFSGDDAMKPTRVLSGGEKTRLALATLVTSRANVLLLDEPTNNLDPASRDEILKAIAKYEGAIVLVTHDEGAVEALNPERVLLMPDGDEDLWNDSYLELVAEE